MKTSIYLLLLLLTSCASGKDGDSARYTIIEHVHVIDVLRGQVLPGRTVVLQDSMILFIGDQATSAPFAPAEVIDGTGQFLLPGLWDMHFHLCWERSNDSLLLRPLLAHGITGIRDMGGDLAIQAQLKAIGKADPTHGPEIFGPGPILDGNPPVFYDFSIPLDEHTAIPRLLDSLVLNGADFIKTYSLLREPELVQIAQYSQAHHLAFAGHLSEYVAPERSLELGQKSVEHLNRLDEIWTDDPARIDRIADLIVEKESWLCPTLVIYYLKAHMADTTIRVPKYDALVHPILRQEWETTRSKRLARPGQQDTAALQRVLNRQLALVGYLHQRGVNILAGSDFAGMPFVYPGIGLYQELDLLHQAGLTNAEVLAAATINPATYLAIQDHYGSVTVGKIADLILLAKNPLADIENIRTLTTVFRKGRRVVVPQGYLP